MNSVDYGFALVSSRPLQIGHGLATAAQIALVVALVITFDVSVTGFFAGLAVSIAVGGLLGFAVSGAMAMAGKIETYMKHSYAISLMLGLVAALIGYIPFIGYDATLLVVGIPWAFGTVLVFGLHRYAETLSA